MNHSHSLGTHAPLGIALYGGGGSHAHVMQYTGDPNIEHASLITSGAVTPGSIAIGPSGVYQFIGGAFTLIASPYSNDKDRVVFAPNGTDNSGPIYNDWATLVADVNTTGQPTLIDVDLTGGGMPTIPPGTYAFSKPATIRGQGMLFTYLRFGPGTSITGVTEVSDITLEGVGVNNLDGFLVYDVIGRPLTLRRVHITGSLTTINSTAPLMTLYLDSCIVDTGVLHIISGGQISCYALGQTQVAADVFLAFLTRLYISAQSSVDISQSSAAPVFEYLDPDQQTPISIAAPTTLPGRGAVSFNVTTPSGLTVTLPYPTNVYGPLTLKHSGPVTAGNITIQHAPIGPPNIVLSPGSVVTLRSDGTVWSVW